jgi:hypothetical protein
MPKPMSGPDHLDAVASYLADMPEARKQEDWTRLHALAAAAQAHLSTAEFAWRLAHASTAPGERQAQRWLDAAGVDRRPS